VRDEHLLYYQMCLKKQHMIQDFFLTLKTSKIQVWKNSKCITTFEFDRVLGCLEAISLDGYLQLVSSLNRQM
jgi:hypothetical protein